MIFGTIGLVYLAFIIAMLVAHWRIFEKAGRPGWESIIPIYSAYILITKIVKKEGWWIFMLIIPIVNIVFAVKILVALSKAFGKEGSFALLFFIFGIGNLILGFGDDKYLLNEQNGELLDRLDSNY